MTRPADYLNDYALTAGVAVEVELLVTVNDDGQRHYPRTVGGTVVGATERVLVLSGRASDVRIPWPAIALVRHAVTPHPATI